MSEMLEKLISFLDSIWSVCENLITSFFSFFEIIITIPDKIVGFLGFLPGEVLRVVLLVVSLAIAYKIVGRD